MWEVLPSTAVRYILVANVFLKDHGIYYPTCFASPYFDICCRSIDNGDFSDVDQYGEHSDGRSDKKRGDKPLIVIKKKKSNNYIWKLIFKGISSKVARGLLEGFETTKCHTATIFKSPQFPDYAIKRYLDFSIL